MRDGRTVGQRWMRWRNNSQLTCPPWGSFSITNAAVEGEELIFTGDLNRLANDNLAIDQDENVIALGVGWNIGFNWERPVGPGELGYWTCDLPAWCVLIGGGFGSEADSTNFMNGLISLVPEAGTFGLTDAYYLSADFQTPTSGFQLLSTMFIQEFGGIWNEDITDNTRDGLFVGFIGGLVTFLRGGPGEPTGAAT